MKKPYRLSRLLPAARRKTFLRVDSTRRICSAESLETRSMMAALPPGLFTSTYHNPTIAADVNNDGAVKVDDAIAVIRTLRQEGARPVSSGAEGEASSSSGNYYYDVNADGNINIVDAVKVVRILRGEGEAGEQVRFTVKAVPVDGNGSTVLSTIEKGQEFDLLVSIQDLRLKSEFVGPSITGGVLNPKLDIDFDATKAHVESNEIQYLGLVGTNGSTTGTFSLTFDGQTRTVNYSSNVFTTADNILAQLESIPSIGTGNVEVIWQSAIQRWRIRFINELKDTDVPKITGSAAGLSGSVNLVVDDGNYVNGSPTGEGLQGRIEARNTANETPWNVVDASDAADISALKLLGVYDIGIGPNFNASHDINGVDAFGALANIVDPAQGSGNAFPDVQFMRIRMVASEGVSVTGTPTFTTTAKVASDQNDIPLQFLQLKNEVVQNKGEEQGGTVLPADQLFTNITPITILQFVNGVADTVAATPTVGSPNAISINVLANDTKAASVANIQLTRVGSASETLTGNLFASNSGRSALGGTVSIVSGQVQYTPPAVLPAGTPIVGGVAVDSFVYTVEDVAIGTRGNKAAYRDTQIVKINLTVPVLSVTPDSITLPEAANGPSVSYGLNVLSNDSLGPNQPAVVTSLDTTAFDALNIGTIVIANGGAGTSPIVFTPNSQDFFTTDAALGIDNPITFSYTVTDSLNNTATATVTLRITNTNDAPVVPVRSLNVDENTTATINALTGATPGPANESAQTLTLISANATTGTAVVSGNNILYTPPANFTGAATITYVLRDNGNPNLSTTGTINLTVQPIARPSALDDDYDIPEGTATFQMNVLTNDRPHQNSNPVLVSLDSSDVPASVGTVVPTLGPNGFLTFNLAAGATAADFFGGPFTVTYTVADDSGLPDDTNPAPDKTGTVTIEIINVNDAPTALDKEVSVGKNSGPNQINVVAGATVGPVNETAVDVLSVSSVTQGSKGSVTIGVGGNVIYTPNAGQSGTDTFTYTIRDRVAGDPAGLTATATVTVNITPNADNDSFSMPEDSLATDAATTLDVLANDDQFGVVGTLTITAKTNGQHGTVTIVNGGANVQYVPVANFYGTDSFTYTVTDAGGRTSTATVNITLNEVNDNPTAALATTTVVKAFGAQNVTSAILAVISSAPDNAANTNGTPVSETLTVTSVTPVVPNTGLISVSGGVVTYDPTGVAAGTYDFTYTISDGRTGTATGTLRITVLDYVPTNVGGYVYQDSGNGAGGAADNIRNPGEKGYGGVTITIVGTDFLGNAVNLTTTTNADGSYLFPAMVPGTYDIIEEQPKFVIDGAETVGAQGGSVISSFNASTGARDTIRISFPVTGSPSGALGNNFGERGLDAVSLMQSNLANGGPTGNIWLGDLSTSATHAGFFLYVNGSSVSVSQTINGWSAGQITGTLSADKQTLTLTLQPVGGGAPTVKVLTLNAGVQNGFRIMGVDGNGGYLIRIDASAEVMLGANNPFIPTGGSGEGEGFAAGVDAVFAGQ